MIYLTLRLTLFSLTLKKIQIDGRSNSIKRAMENGTKPETFVSTGFQPFDLAIDVIGRHMFWSCSHANTINITRYFLKK